MNEVHTCAAHSGVPGVQAAASCPRVQSATQPLAAAPGTNPEYLICRL